MDRARCESRYEVIQIKSGEEIEVDQLGKKGAENFEII